MGEDATEVNPFLVNREFRMNLYAVKAMLARVYCYKGDAESKRLAVSIRSNGTVGNRKSNKPTTTSTK